MVHCLDVDCIRYKFLVLTFMDHRHPIFDKTFHIFNKPALSFLSLHPYLSQPLDTSFLYRRVFLLTYSFWTMQTATPHLMLLVILQVAAGFWNAIGHLIDHYCYFRSPPLLKLLSIYFFHSWFPNSYVFPYIFSLHRFEFIACLLRIYFLYHGKLGHLAFLNYFNLLFKMSIPMDQFHHPSTSSLSLLPASSSDLDFSLMKLFSYRHSCYCYYHSKFA